MKNALAWAIGLLLIAVAIFLAAGSSNQDTTPQPQVARVLATTFHTTPSPTPTITPISTGTPTLTPVPTVTAIPGWIRLNTVDMQLLVPPALAGELIHVVPSVQQRENGSILDEAIITCPDCKALPAAAGGFIGSDVEPGIRLVKVKIAAEPDLFPYTLIGLGYYDYRLDNPQPVDLGRYRAYRAIASGPSTGGEPLTKLMYWIDNDSVRWVILFTASSADFQSRLPLFEQVARSVTILPQGKSTATSLSVRGAGVRDGRKHSLYMRNYAHVRFCA